MALQYDNPVWTNEFTAALAANPSISETTTAAISSLLGLDTVESVVVAGWDGVAADITVPEGKTADVLAIAFTGTEGTELTLPASAEDAKVIIVQSDVGVNLTVGEEAASSARLALSAVDTSAVARVIVGGNGNDTLTVNGSTNVVLDGADGDDTLTTGSGNDVIIAGTGTNTIDAGAGNDTIVTGLGIDTINAGAGRDTIQVEAASTAFNATAAGSTLVLTGTGTSEGNSVSVTDGEFVSFNDGKTLAIVSTEAQADALRLYEGLLGRTADNGGAESFSAEIAAGTATVKSVAQTFLTSDEHYTSLRTDFLSDLYSSLLGRDVDAAGQATWLQQFEQGASRGDIVASIANSAEGQTAAGTDAEFVTALYTSALGRPVETAGLDNWVAQLESGAASRVDVANSIYSSDEAVVHNNAEFVASLFTNVGIAADSLTTAGYELALANGASQADVAIAIIGSPEAEANIHSVIVVPGAV